MKVFIAISLMGMTSLAKAETMAASGQGSFMIVPAPATSVPKKVENKPVQKKIEAPTEDLVDADVPVVLKTQSGTPYGPSLHGAAGSCPDVVAHPNAQNTPVKVFVDQQRQTVEIFVLDEQTEEWRGRVSTGGGLKVPNGKGRKPYCARTPKQDRKIISAVTEDMFKGTSCTPDEIRGKTTVFPVYHSGAFTDENGNGVPMPNAVRIEGGIFFHEVPPKYTKLLGQNVSGECVRMEPLMAEKLRNLTLKYGAIEVTMSPAPFDTLVRCNDETLAEENRRQREGLPSQNVTGSEGVYGGQELLLKKLEERLGHKYDPNKDVGLF